MKVIENTCINCLRENKKAIFVIKDDDIETTKLYVCENCPQK